MTDILENDFAAASLASVPKAARTARATAFRALKAAGALFAAMPHAISQAFVSAYVDPFAARGNRPFGDNPENY